MLAPPRALLLAHASAVLQAAVRRSLGTHRAFSTSALRLSEGAPSGHGQSAFNKREKAAEDIYVKQLEEEKLAKLRKTITAHKEELAEMEKSVAELEKAVKDKPSS